MDKDKIVFKGSHPDSLYRVPASADTASGKLIRGLRLLRWPAALVTVCVALTVFVYFLIPSNLEQLEAQNGTIWIAGVPEAQSNNRLFEEKSINNYKGNSPKHTNSHGPFKTSEIDFYGPDNEKSIDMTDVIEEIAVTNPKQNLPIQPVFPSHISLEVQYGNEEADSDKIRTGKTFEEALVQPDDSTLKPHITQKPEKPLEINIKNVDSTISVDNDDPLIKAVETVATAETTTDVSDFEKLNSEKDKRVYIKKKEPTINEELNRQVSGTAAETEEFVLSDLNPINTEVVGGKFTSGHSKFFGVSIEDVGMIKSTTQSSAYKTRVSPTLPTWRDRDGTTKKYPVNINSDVSNCDSTRLPMCRGILPYDLAGPPTSFDGIPLMSYLPQIEYLIASNCSSRLIHFACSLLEPECNAPPYPPLMPCYNLCRAITDSCENLIPRELASVFNCNGYSSGNCLSAKSPCYERELLCGDGNCVPRDWMCDGSNDCPGGEDEATCVVCEPQEFRCQSGACILKRWLCDGYIDCEDGSDESVETCAGRGILLESTGAAHRVADEETAGSAPAPSIRRPNRLPGSSRPTEEHAQAENESSKELLITSDSNNALKRNFTRRPPLSRLSPYSRANYQEKGGSINFKTPIISNKADQDPLKVSVKPKGDEDMTIFGDLAKAAAQMQTSDNKQVKIEESKPSKEVGRAPEPDKTPVTRLDKSLNKLERVIDGASMIRITEAPMPPEEYEEYPQRASGHASPCPSGELRCVDGRCITLAQLCDGTVDCSDHADEDNCYT